MPTWNDEHKSYASAGVGNTALALAATALGTNIFGNGLGLGGLFGGNQNPTSNATYQLAQKDTIIAKLEAERYADQQNNIVQIEISNLKQRLAAMEAAAPLRERIVSDQIGFVGGTVGRLVKPMVPDSSVAYPTTTSNDSAS